MAIHKDSFRSVLERLKQVQEIVKINENIYSQLKYPQRVIEVCIPVKMDDGTIRTFIGYRCQYNDARGPYKGGIRFHPDAGIEDVKVLGALMTWKTALVNIPLGGAKGSVMVDAKKLSLGELERLSRGYIRALHKYIGPDIDIPAPDVYTNPRVMGWMMDEYESIKGKHQPGVITGKPLSIGGSEVREYSTAQGAFYILNEAVKRMGFPKNATVGIQGFGNAGGKLAKILQKNGYRVVVVSDSKGTAINFMGLDIDDLMNHKKETGSVADYPGSEKIKGRHCFEQDVDVLVPAALENAITEDNVDIIKAKVIVELANNPITPEADAILQKRNILVIPDILANAGGVVVSYLEQVQNSTGWYWSEQEVLDKFKKIMLDSLEDVWKTKDDHSTTLRMAAYVIAIKKVAKAMEDRGRI